MATTDIDPETVEDETDIALLELDESTVALAVHEDAVEAARAAQHQAIAAAYRRGIAWQVISSRTGLSKPRIYQVLAAQGVATKRSTA